MLLMESFLIKNF